MNFLLYISQDKCFECLKKRKENKEKVKSEDFYDEIRLQYVINEYERANQSKKDYEKILFEKSDGSSNFEANKLKYINFI